MFIVLLSGYKWPVSHPMWSVCVCEVRLRISIDLLKAIHHIWLQNVFIRFLKSSFFPHVTHNFFQPDQDISDMHQCINHYLKVNVFAAPADNTHTHTHRSMPFQWYVLHFKCYTNSYQSSNFNHFARGILLSKSIFCTRKYAYEVQASNYNNFGVWLDKPKKENASSH